jgi:hypothetical protein
MASPSVALQPRTSSWTSQRTLEAQVIALQQQLDISAATQLELQKEIEVQNHTLTVSTAFLSWGLMALACELLCMI